MKHFILIILAAFTAFGAIASQKMQTFTNKVKDGYNFWLTAPKEAKNDTVKRPLVIFLHGASLKGKDLNKVLRYGTLDAIKRGLDLDAYVLAPQTSSFWSPKRLKNTMDYVTSQHADIDTTRIYVIGMSLGGYGTIDFAATYPDNIAAAMAICGGGSVSDLSELGKVPLWIVHGTNDRAVSVKESDKVVDKIKQGDDEAARLLYSRVQGMNHSEPARLLYMPKVYQWLFEHKLTDEDRAMASGFHIDSKVMKSAYRDMKSEKVSSLPNPQFAIIEPEPTEEKKNQIFLPTK